MLTPHKSMFFAGFAVIPAVFWFGSASHSMEQRHDAHTRMDNAYQVVAQNQLKVSNSTRLQSEWEEFKPLAEAELENLDDDLNPVLIQKRVLAVGRSIGFEAKSIRQMNDPKTESPQWFLEAESSWENLVTFVDQLERGKYRVRFSQVSINLPSEEYADGAIKLSAFFTIPEIKQFSEVTSNG